MLDFKELKADGNDFELLVRELLFSIGMKVHWSGKGPDGGKDLLCIETLDSKFQKMEKIWLVQCKHFAHSERAVSVNDLDSVIDSCSQHGASGYLLICSTFPSSAVVNRLESINAQHGLNTAYWDGTTIERYLSTPKTWPIAQRFFPISASSEDWNIYATENPNRWIINYKGYYMHLANRIGSYSDVHLSAIQERIKEIESVPLSESHMLRPRALHYDDKNANYMWYIDYLVPDNEEPKYPIETLKKILRDGWVFDGACNSVDLRIYKYNRYSDHYDKDHYDYYRNYLEQYYSGTERKKEWYDFEFKHRSITESSKHLEVEEHFNDLVGALSRLDYVKILRATNSKVEFVDCFSGYNSWEDIMKAVNYEADLFLSARITFISEDEAKLDNLLRKFPQPLPGTFTFSKRFVYYPGLEVHEQPEEVNQLTISIIPAVSNPREFRVQLNDYIKELTVVIEDELKTDGSRIG
ncbi:restriction endonuclease [Paenibacillus sp. JZ16]|uniref:restriction endonuclease n=1 Tax=Paenibacillus sp. JZ16 TaxID=1906272 RepID=UPI00188B23F1|nr:restriction endonuclease [Paenibacillus sp. JZ16]